MNQTIFLFEVSGGFVQWNWISKFGFRIIGKLGFQNNIGFLLVCLRRWILVLVFWILDILVFRTQLKFYIKSNQELVSVFLVSRIAKDDIGSLKTAPVERAM